MQEYPKWLHRAGLPDVLVQSASEEDAQIAAWEGKSKPAPVANKLTEPEPVKTDDDPPADDELSDLRNQYQEKFNKRPFMGWGADILRAKLAQAE